MGVIKDRAHQMGARVAEFMRGAMRMYMQRSGEHTYGKEC